MKASELQALAVPHLDALYRYALRLSRDPERAEDLVQDTCVRAIAAAESFHSEQEVRPKLFRILYNHFVDQWRSQRRRPMMVSSDELEEQGQGGY